MSEMSVMFAALVEVVLSQLLLGELGKQKRSASVPALARPLNTFAGIL